MWALVIGIVCAVVDWVAVMIAPGRRAIGRALEVVFKPATLIAFVVGAFLMGADVTDPHLARWFRIALICSLAGDIFLMLPGDRWFIPGLLAFLLGHVGYIVGFNAEAVPVGALVPLAVVAVVDLLVLRRIVGALVRSGETTLRIPVVVYGIVLSLTLVSGWATWFRPGWPTAARITASLGATLFYASDLMLAWDRFVAKSQLLHVLVIVTYHIGQLGLVLTIGLR